eukprot:TRINITY_DN28836_c0_g1_i2.p1 TRINITY_DN28836_c0_g1~~TRINITY_DN28836_c0_g1_i2.p1  ORF type:complete len:160 (-),score=25.81 TRINITY_DN28836_c0_g1_i2:85-564(-)
MTHKRRIYFTTHQKELSIGDYIPSTSAHHPRGTKSLMLCEINRYIVTNTFAADFEKQCHGFMVKLRRRGLSTGSFAQILSLVSHDSRPQRIRPRTAKPRNDFIKAGLTVRYCKGIETLHWGRLRNLMKSINVNLELRYSSGKNLFRTLYRSTWKGGSGR